MSQPTAQTLMDIYDETGEANLAIYLLHTMGRTDSPWKNSETATFPDHSQLVRHRHDEGHAGIDRQSLHYHFSWPEHQDERTHVTSMHTHARPASERAEFSMPAKLSTGAMPDTDSITTAVMEIAAIHAARNLGKPGPMRPESIHEIAVANIIAPSLRRAVNQSIEDDDQPNALADQIEEMELEYADDAINYMEHEDYQSLVDHYTSLIRAGWDGAGPTEDIITSAQQ